jgi:hypothetical protein
MPCRNGSSNNIINQRFIITIWLTAATANMQHPAIAVS